MRIGAFGGLSLASGADVLASDERTAGASANAAAIARRLRRAAPYPGGWLPYDLFANGEQGAWYDPSDLSTLFQDSDGTIPVTGIGQPVGRVLDKSGNGNHLIQPTAVSRPVWTRDSVTGLPCLQFDGVDDHLYSANAVDLTLTSAFSLFLGLSSNARGALVQHGDGISTNTGVFDLTYGFPDISDRIYFRNKGTTQITVNPLFGTVGLFAVTALGSIAQNVTILRSNGQQLVQSVNSPGTGTYSSRVLYVGMLADLSRPWLGRMNAIIVRGALSNAIDLVYAESWVANKTRAVLVR
jgi:hypothetical protein